MVRLSTGRRAQLEIGRGHFETQQLAAADMVVGPQPGIKPQWTTVDPCGLQWSAMEWWSAVRRAQLGIGRGHFKTQQLAAADTIVGLQQATRIARNQALVDDSGALWSAVEWWSAVTGELSEGSVGDRERTLVTPFGAFSTFMFLVCLYQFFLLARFANSEGSIFVM